MKYSLLCLFLMSSSALLAQEPVTFTPKKPKKLTVGLSFGNFHSSINKQLLQYADRSNDVVNYTSTSGWAINSIDLDIIQRNVWFPKFNIYWNLNYSLTSAVAHYNVEQPWQKTRYMEVVKYPFYNPLTQFSVGMGFEYSYQLHRRWHLIPSFCVSLANFNYNKYDTDNVNESRERDIFLRTNYSEHDLVVKYNNKTPDDYANNFFVITRTKLNLVYYVSKGFGFTLSPMLQLGFNKIDEGGFDVIDATTLGQRYYNSSSVTRTTSGFSLQLGMRVAI